MTWGELMCVFHRQPCLSLLLQLLPHEDGRELREILARERRDILWDTHEEMLRVGVELSEEFRLDVVNTLTAILRVFSKHGPHKQQELQDSNPRIDTVMRPTLDEGESDMSDDASHSS